MRCLKTWFVCDSKTLKQTSILGNHYKCLTICKCISILSKTFSGSPSIKTFFGLKGLGCHIASYTPSNLLPLEILWILVSFPLWKKLMGQLLLVFLCKYCSFFSFAEGVLVTKRFYCCWRYALAMQQFITRKEHMW